jgi:CheY-like chemotaxis protein
MLKVGGGDGKINLSRATCLAVDDSPMALEILAQVMGGFGVGKLIKADSAQEAQKIVKDTPLDFIVTDGHMPEMDGYELVKWVRSLEDSENRFIPILLATGETRLSHVFRARDCGANFVVAKPITPKVLLDRLVWMARDKRDFIEAETYVGPDRRFKREGPPPGMSGRRHDDLSGKLGDAKEPNMSTDEIAMMMKPTKVTID